MNGRFGRRGAAAESHGRIGERSVRRVSDRTVLSALTFMLTVSAPSPRGRPRPPCLNTRTRSPPEPSGPSYSARVALSCESGHAPGEVLHALQELRQVIDERLREDLGGRYDRHSAQSVGTDKLTVTFTLRAATHADAIRSAGLAAGTLAELLAHNAAAVDLSGVRSSFARSNAM